MFGTRKILAGASSGVVGGLIFGLMMAKMGTLPMIGKMIGSPTVAAGWLVHLGISAAIGASFAVLLGLARVGPHEQRGVRHGLRRSLVAHRPADA